MAKDFIYKKIEENILNEIKNGFFSPGDKLPPARVYAKTYETSEITVNKALNNLAEKGYIQRSTGIGSIVLNKDDDINKTGCSIEKKYSRLIGVIVFDISHPFWSGTIRGVEEVCQQHNFNLLVGNDDGSLYRAEQYIRNFIDQGVEGIIFVPIGQNSKELYETENLQLIQMIDSSGIPYTLLHRKVESIQTSVSQIENYQAAFEASNLLLEQNIANPICISQYYSHVVMEREKGFLDAMTEAGFDDANDRIYRLHPVGQTVSSREFSEVEAILTSDDSIDGILTITADMLKLVALVEDADLVSPKKIVSFDYNPLIFRRKNIIAMLETLNVEMGRVAAEMLIDKLLKKRKFDVQSSISPVFHVKKGLMNSISSFHKTKNKIVFHE